MISKTLPELLNNAFGVRTRVNLNPVVSSVGTVPTQIVGNNPNRVGLLIVNLGVNNLFVLPEPDPSAAKGILLAPNGGDLVITWYEDFDWAMYEEWGIAPAGAVNILTIEVITY